MDFSNRFNEYINLVNSELEGILTVPNNYQRVVYEAMKYSVDAGGKRVRPVLALAVCDMLGGDVNVAIRYGAAIELIHTYSLIHDDLPCMDNDDLRRGKPTCHKVFGEAIALLAGDGLLTRAFEVMSEKSALPDSQVLRIINTVSQAAGCNGMIGGQTVDMLCEGGVDGVTLEKLKFIHLNKTAKLLEASAVLGALTANVAEKEVEKISKFSINLGLAFQVKDDILDIVGNSDELGKATGRDIERGKTTFVTLMGLDESQIMLNELTKNAMEELRYFDGRNKFLQEFLKYLLIRNY